MNLIADQTVSTNAIRPFPPVKVSDAELADLRRRITATRWPTRELVPDQSQGAQLAMAQVLARYWSTDYDWRKCELKLNAIPQFLTEIDGQQVHFIHVRSKDVNALPLIVTHGWPGSIVEQLKIVEPLTNPTAHGANANDAFHLVIPSIPGHEFSPEAETLGWDPVRIAKAWLVLMERLGYDRFVAQRGDWGANVTQELALLAPAKVIAIHTNMPSTVPEAIGADATIALDDPAFATIPQVDIVANALRGKTATDLLAKVKDGGTFVSVTGAPDGTKDYPKVRVGSFVSTQDRALIAFIAHAVNAGKMTIPIDHREKLEKAGAAQAAFTKGGIGKVLLIP